MVIFQESVKCVFSFIQELNFSESTQPHQTEGNHPQIQESIEAIDISDIFIFALFSFDSFLRADPLVHEEEIKCKNLFYSSTHNILIVNYK